jgi:hypothetical protein
VEKPTAFWLAQSRMEEVSAPDCDTSASGPGAAIGPATLALSPARGSLKAQAVGAQQVHAVAARQLVEFTGQRAALIPVEMTTAARHLMRPAMSSAAATSSCGSAMMARSARVCARSASVPVVWMSRKVRVPVKALRPQKGQQGSAHGASVWWDHPIGRQRPRWIREKKAN